MTQKKQIYKCEICGNIVEVLHEGVGTLVCCGQPMKLQTEKTKDEGKEKHIPIIEGVKVKVGSVEHPMTKEHHIEWIEANCDGKTCRVFLTSGDKPKAEFQFNVKKARAYCNLHGLWKS